MAMDDVDVHRGIALITRGKGGKGRFVPFGSQTAKAIDRYLRLRRAHPLAETSTLWLGSGGQGFTYAALWRTLNLRADRAGIKHTHPHQLRHTGAQRWLSAGGSENGLMAVGGWADRSSMDRYVRASASERAIREAGRLNLGDL